MFILVKKKLVAWLDMLVEVKYQYRFSTWESTTHKNNYFFAYKMSVKKRKKRKKYVTSRKSTNHLNIWAKQHQCW